MATNLRIWIAIVSFCWLAYPSHVAAQGFGGFGSAANSVGPQGEREEGIWQPDVELPALSPESALHYITIDGTAEVRVVPDGIRVVFAIISEGATADECQTKNDALVQSVVNTWKELDIDEEDIVQDFINLLPVYKWQVLERDGEPYRGQQHDGYRMQTNLHVSVVTEEDAMSAIRLAFQQGVSDIVTFDYWNAALDEQKMRARNAALEAAKQKSETLLAVFSERPKVINIQESTAVFEPHSLYRTYDNVLEEEVKYTSSWNDKPMILAYRPKMTFYQGLQGRLDVRPTGAAMRPEIAVVSTVRIYYESPASGASGTQDK